jgi:hypothetical protein
MLSSVNPAWVSRAGLPDPVEGDSEIDIAMTGDGYVLFVEAKLGSDVSARTTYDPSRNQIVRNIDCVIEQADSRRPLFWMLVKDRLESRAYVQLIQTYRESPRNLASMLSHRSQQVLDDIAMWMAIVTWSEIIDGLTPHDDEEKAVLDEIQHRVA